VCLGKRKFDVVVVWKFDRFARSVSHLLRALETFQALGIEFVSLTEGVDTSTPAGKMVFTVLGAVAELERSLIVGRVKAGLRNERANGKRLGRPKVVVSRSRIAFLRSEGRSWSLDHLNSHKIASVSAQEPGAHQGDELLQKLIGMHEHGEVPAINRHKLFEWSFDFAEILPCERSRSRKVLGSLKEKHRHLKIKPQILRRRRPYLWNEAFATEILPVARIVHILNGTTGSDQRPSVPLADPHCAAVCSYPPVVAPEETNRYRAISRTDQYAWLWCGAWSS
jgi:hypothetical protein